MKDKIPREVDLPPAKGDFSLGQNESDRCFNFLFQALKTLDYIVRAQGESGRHLEKPSENRISDGQLVPMSEPTIVPVKRAQIAISKQTGSMSIRELVLTFLFALTCAIIAIPIWMGLVAVWEATNSVALPVLHILQVLTSV